MSLPVILPGVRQLIVCDRASFEEVEDQWVIRQPWSTRFLGEGVQFPFSPPELWAYIELTGGLGPVCLGLLVDRKVDFRESPNPDEDFQPRYETIWARVSTEPCVFPSDVSRQTVYVLSVSLPELEFPDEGVYEFRVIALFGMSDEGEPDIRPLPGEPAEVFILDPARKL